MNTLTIKSRKTGDEYNFWMPTEGGFIHLIDDAHPGTSGRQICEGGGFRGDTLRAMPETFERACRRWYRQMAQES